MPIANHGKSCLLSLLVDLTLTEHLKLLCDQTWLTSLLFLMMPYFSVVIPWWISLVRFAIPGGQKNVKTNSIILTSPLLHVNIEKAYKQNHQKRFLVFRESLAVSHTQILFGFSFSYF